MYHEMVKHISADTVVLSDPKTAADDIDRVLNTMLRESRPVYIGVPVDMSHLECDAHGLEIPLETKLSPNDADLEQKVVVEIRSCFEQKRSPIIIVDGNAVRNNQSEVSRKLSMLTGLPTFTTCMGKGALDETQPNFGGVYQGAGSHPGVRKAVETSDCVLWIGNVQASPHFTFQAANNSMLIRVQTDFNTGEFTDNVPEDATIEFQRFSVKV
jgi:pyruvate decarboxylase